MHGRTHARVLAGPAGEAQEWVRIMLTTVGRGGDGQKIRDEILNIMHRNNIPEKKGLWIEEWHQKLHNNTSPDDVVVCQALLDYIAGGVGGGRQAGRTSTCMPAYWAAVRTYFPLFVRVRLSPAPKPQPQTPGACVCVHLPPPISVQPPARPVRDTRTRARAPPCRSMPHAPRPSSQPAVPRAPRPSQPAPPLTTRPSQPAPPLTPRLSRPASASSPRPAGLDITAYWRTLTAAGITAQRLKSFDRPIVR